MEPVVPLTLMASTGARESRSDATRRFLASPASPLAPSPPRLGRCQQQRENSDLKEEMGTLHVELNLIPFYSSPQRDCCALPFVMTAAPPQF